MIVLQRFFLATPIKGNLSDKEVNVDACFLSHNEVLI